MSPPPALLRVPGVRPLWEPTPALARRVSGAVVLVLGLVVLTGAVVRLSGSGLGCPTWPRCTATDVASGWDVHGVIEFGNRLISVVVFAVGIAALTVLVLRSGRRDLRRYVAALVLGYLAEAVLGGITVRTRLNPLTVSAHFLLAIALLWVAVVLWRRLGTAAGAPRPVVGRELRLLGRALVAGALLVLVVGTLVTGTGPHAGSRVDNRLPFDRRAVTLLHSDIVLVLLGAVLVTVLLLRLTGAPRLLRRRAVVVLAVLLAQALIGFVQYATGLPSWLVGIHVAGAAAFFVAVLLLNLDMVERPVVETYGPVADPEPAPSSYAALNA